ncbi:MAG: sugar kinase [Oscillatoriophycideae cyanobacterium NC_groundwater_1537_Pr4_S-0.65um_50_18]|nr:sugar kinase [Oscillatoriophycideae cyanobacterium NC_groundwater_1537_Pr4_S-0.65um_50_18]
MSRRGLFVGMVALDMIYLVEQLPDRNQKIVAIDFTTSAGGPATNAAVTFSYLGNSATLMGSVGTHALSQIIRADLQQWQVELVDLDPQRRDPVPTASILVTQATGDRAVVSLTAPHASFLPANHSPITHSPNPQASINLDSLEIVLIDGHQMALSKAIAQQAHALAIPVVADCGSWKPGFEEVLPYVSHAICSANFYPPQCQTAAEVLAYLEALAVPHVAITGGDQPIQFLSRGQFGEISVTTVAAVDTLGAGDIFHGAFCHFLLHHTPTQSGFTDALAQAVQVASYSCQFFGTRRWMESGKLFF